MARIYVVPVNGAKIRLPHDPQRHLPEEGWSVEHDTFWQRRLDDRDVVIVPEPTPET